MKRKQIRLKQPNISGVLLFTHFVNFSELDRKLYWILQFELHQTIRNDYV